MACGGVGWGNTYRLNNNLGTENKAGFRCTCGPSGLRSVPSESNYPVIKRSLELEVPIRKLIAISNFLIINAIVTMVPSDNLNPLKIYKCMLCVPQLHYTVDLPHQL
jgi:hypothetical protein